MPKQGKKGTKLEVSSRINVVYGLLATATSRQEIILHCAEKFNVSERQADTYITRARNLIQKDCELSRPAFLAECLSRLKNYEKKAIQKGQLQVAVNSVRLQAELVGINS